VAHDRVRDDRRIAVGVDGSATSRAALIWAARHAALTGAVVEAVIAWEHPAGDGQITAQDTSQGHIAAQILAEVIADADSSDPVRSRVLKGHQARVLIEASAGAELLVARDRRHAAEFLGAPLGPVSQRCVQHAHCPVLVVRGAGPVLRRTSRPVRAACQPQRPPRMRHQVSSANTYICD
jgi:nucleotide-binding universal stress UspA family protein